MVGEKVRGHMPPYVAPNDKRAGQWIFQQHFCYPAPSSRRGDRGVEKTRAIQEWGRVLHKGLGAASGSVCLMVPQQMGEQCRDKQGKETWAAHRAIQKDAEWRHWTKLQVQGPRSSLHPSLSLLQIWCGYIAQMWALIWKIPQNWGQKRNFIIFEVFCYCLLFCCPFSLWFLY